jgi:hypothetical protein
MTEQNSKLITLDEFKALKREDMFATIVSINPDLGKGMSRAPKAELISFYESILKVGEIDSILAMMKERGITVSKEALARIEEPPSAEEKALIGVDHHVMDVDYRELEARAMAMTYQVDTSNPAGIMPVEPLVLPMQPPRKGRRDTVYSLIRKLPKDKLLLLAEYKRIPLINRKTRLKKEALGKQCRRFLPAGVTLDEALMVIG